MALIHWAELRPSKIELLQDWIPMQPWLGDLDPAGLTALGAYRFDDPDGDVGIETHLLGTERGVVLQVPLTYRPEPLEGIDSIATMHHSVLGQRWVYDGLTDPVYLQAVVTTVLTGAEQAELYRIKDGQRQTLPATARVRGSGRPGAEVPPVQPGPIKVEGHASVVETGAVVVSVRHLIDAQPAPDDGLILTGSWNGQEELRWLAEVRASSRL